MADKTKIVMIDDEEDLCLMVKANLEDTDEFEVVTSGNAAEAEQFIAQENPALVLLDVVMPERKGSDIAAALRKNEATQRIPIIMVSGKGEMVYNRKKDDFKWMPNSKVVEDRGEIPEAKGAEALAEAYGVDDYISKPFTTDLLVEVINEVLARYKKKNDAEEDQAL